MGGIPLLNRVYSRAQLGGRDTIVLTPDVSVEQYCRENGIRCFRSVVEGRRLDKELLQLANAEALAGIVLVTGDCPFVSFEYIERIADVLNETSCEFAMVQEPKGMGVRGVRIESLRQSVFRLDAHGEHGLTYFYDKFQPSCRNLPPYQKTFYDFSVNTLGDLLIADLLAKNTDIDSNIATIVNMRHQLEKEHEL